jgi:fructose-1,6-bisphosphatase
MKNVKTISRYELLKVIRKIDGKQATYISLFTQTKVKLKTRNLNNPFGNVIYKISKVVGLINFNYEKMVQKKDTEYEVSERSWGKKTNDDYNGTLIDHKENDYIAIAIQKVVYKNPKFVTTEGKLTDKSKIEPFLSEKKESHVESLGIVYRNYKLESIKKATINGITYKVSE